MNINAILIEITGMSNNNKKQYSSRTNENFAKNKIEFGKKNETKKPTQKAQINQLRRCQKNNNS